MDHGLPQEVNRVSADGRIHAPMGYRLHSVYWWIWSDTRRLCDELACPVCMHSCDCWKCVCNCRNCVESHQRVTAVRTNNPAGHASG